MSDTEKEPVQDQFDDEEVDFSKLKKKKKSKKKVEFDAEAEPVETQTEEKPVEQQDDAEEDPEAMFADLKKKKKKKSKLIEEDTPDADSSVANTDEDLDFSGLKKKKKKKKSMAQFEADLADENADENEVTEEKTNEKEAGEDAWVKSDRDYAYDELLDRVFNILRQNNPELAGEKKKYTIVPPSIHREGNKKTIFANIAEISKRLHRPADHVIQFLFAELGTTGSIDGAQRLIIKGRFQQKQIENVLRRYIVEYVTCKTCKSPNTIMTKDNRLYFVTCEHCGSSRTVSAIKTGFKAQTKEDRRAQRA
ncbi:domain found in IF2B/IF5-domain-containing protein [Cokeromyces recurvatus]|uniref:domain found in IF2B/IF5-domain-containing protein n=1 Tax=Cokeromyces recurvatus TaxID=90255 RepID=UPI00222017E6|nr:domain found in IF2B/IF5-domain-containing protein [Cokeromyces recurvatus]KAI7897661.1 domain found in IF2B/IF5-domain-containing protein [Cokeromyces recurvatus]